MFLLMNDLAALTRLLASRYAIVREIGIGGMATVYLARDVRHGREVALKVLHPELSAVIGPDRFLKEIELTARLQHPHILPLFDSGDANGRLYYVMPFVDGETLRARLSRETQLPIADAVRLACEVADALHYAHAQGIIHRDIKPENILLQGGHALVADFGIALAVQQAGGARMTQTGLSLGTPQYMSPEQAMGEKTLDARTDVYALGAITYEMLTGEPPFTGASSQAIVARVLTAAPAPIRQTRSTVPPHVEQAVLAALAKLPADRPSSAQAFAQSLQRAAAEPVNVAASAPSTGNNRRPGAIALGALGIAALSGLAGWLAAPAAGSGGSDASGGNSGTVLTSILPPAGGNFAERRSVALSPDGQRIAFVFASSDGARSLWLRHLGQLDAEPVPRTNGADAPFWSRDGRTLGFFGAEGIALVEDNGVPRLLCPARNPTGASWGADGMIVFGHRDGISTVSSAGGPCRLVVARKSGELLKAEFLPDGKRIVYSRGRDRDLLVANADGSTADTLRVRTSEFQVVAPNLIMVPPRDAPLSVDAMRFNPTTFAIEGAATRLFSDLRNAGGVLSLSLAANGAAVYLPGTPDPPYVELDARGVLRDTVRIDGMWTIASRPSRAGKPLSCCTPSIRSRVAQSWSET